MPLTHNIADIPVVLRLAGADREPCLTPEGGPLDRATPDHRKLLAGLQDRVAAALAGGGVSPAEFLKDPLAALARAGLGLSEHDLAAVQALALPGIGAELTADATGLAIRWEEKP
jgi:hypothetical protein